MVKVKKLPSKRVWYKATHPIYGSDNIFDSWMTLCECTFDLAREEAIKRLETNITDLAHVIADEMIDTIEEYECD